jgi:hypothetical protein
MDDAAPDTMTCQSEHTPPPPERAPNPSAPPLPEVEEPAGEEAGYGYGV